jgi:hypothetical protein
LPRLDQREEQILRRKGPRVQSYRAGDGAEGETEGRIGTRRGSAWRPPTGRPAHGRAPRSSGHAGWVSERPRRAPPPATSRTHGSLAIVVPMS